MTKLNRKRWVKAGNSETIERGPVIVYVDKTETHPYRGVYVTAKDHCIDIYGNPMGLRDAGYNAFQIAVQNGKKADPRKAA